MLDARTPSSREDGGAARWVAETATTTDAAHDNSEGGDS